MDIKILDSDTCEIIRADSKEELFYVKELMTACNDPIIRGKGMKPLVSDPICVLYDYCKFPIGMLQVLVDDPKIYVNIVNKEDWVHSDLKLNNFRKFFEEFGLPFQPYDYQARMAFYPIKFGRSFNVGATGSGKTYISYLTMSHELYRKNVKKCLVVVPSVLLVEQFASDYLEYFDSCNVQKDFQIRPYKIHGTATNRYDISDCNIVVSTYQSLSNIIEKDPKFTDQFDCLFLDEAHGVRSPSMIDIVYHIGGNIKIRFGMTGTLPKGKVDVLMIKTYIGYHFETYKAHELIGSGRATPIKFIPITVHHGKDSVLRLHNTLLKTHIPKYIQEQFDEYNAQQVHHGLPMATNIIAHYPKFEWESVYENNQATRSAEELHTITCDERNELLCELISKHKKNFLVLTKRVLVVKEMGKRLQEYYKKHGIKKQVHIIAGDVNKSVKARDKIKALVQSDPYGHDIVANMDIFSTGISIKALFNAMFINIGKSDTGVVQAVGRLMRLHELKETARIYDVSDNFKLPNNIEPHINLIPYNNKKSYLVKHQKERLKYYKEEKHVVTKMNDLQLS